MNDWKDILLAIASIVTAFGGLELLKYLLNRKNINRVSAADAFKAEYKSIIEDYHRVRKEVDDAKREISSLNKKVDDLYRQVHTLENERLDLIKRNAELELALKEARHNECVRPDDECFKGRLPKRTYCRLKKLAAGDYDEYYDEYDVNENQKEDAENKDRGVSEKPDQSQHT